MALPSIRAKDVEHQSLIELPSSSFGRASSASAASSSSSSSSVNYYDNDKADADDAADERTRINNNHDGSTSFCYPLFAIIGSIALLVGVYYLGLKEGEHDGQKMVELNARMNDGGMNQEDIITSDNHPPIKPPSFTLDHIKETRKECDRLITLLEKYYFGKNQTVNMLMNSFIDPWDFNISRNEYDDDDDDADANAKYNRASKLIDTITRALVTDTQTQFKIGGIGSSIMAGHDNCRYDSYESQMERTFAPIWKAAGGMEFIFQNGGIGGSCGDSYKNGVLCVAQTISPDVDIVHYEWTNYEHGGEGEGSVEGHHESLIRWAQMLPKSPPVAIFNTGVMPKVKPYYPGPDTVEYYYPPDTQLVRHYANYGFNAFYMKSAFLNGGHNYDAEPFDRFGWGYVGDGYHNCTRYGELEEDETRKSSLGVVMRNWHPGPLAFQLTSDAFTYVYTQAIIKSLDLIEKEIKSGKDPRQKWSASKRPKQTKNDLPTPLFCNPEYCVVNEVPSCLNYELPTYGIPGARVIGPNETLNPYRGQTQNWNIWQGTPGIWDSVGKQDTSFFKSHPNTDIVCSHLNACGGMTSTDKAGDTVVFRLPKMEVGLVVICGCCGKQVAKQMFMENLNIEISYNSVPIRRDGWDLWPNNKCVRVMKRFGMGTQQSDRDGESYLAVSLLNDMRGSIKISHVITL